MTERSPDFIDQCATFFYGELQAGRPFRPAPEEIAPRSEDEAYSVQERLDGLLEAGQGPAAGYKVAFTTAALQQHMGMDGPAYGTILSAGLHQSPAELSLSKYVQLAIESEIAVELGDDLPASAAPFTRDSIAGAVSAVMPAFEVVDLRNADRSQLASNVLSAMCLNTFCAGAVLGARVPDWRGIDLVEVGGELTVNGEFVGKGAGGDVMGHPLEAVAWLANTFAHRGKGLTRGSVVLTGSIIPPNTVSSGDSVRFRIDRLGEVSLTVGP